MNIPVPAPVPAILRHDPNSHYHWLELARRAPVEAIADLKRTGWRWSRYREQWYTNRRYYAVPASFDVTDEGECDYSAERADRLEERAGKHYGDYQAKHAAAHARASMIPFGQPVLIGHHSQRSDERNRDRIHTQFGKAFAELDESKRLSEQAESSRRHQAHKQTAPAMTRRVDRLRVEERQLERIIAAQLPDRAEAGEDGASVATYRKQCDWRLERVRSEIAELTEAIEAAGGLVADHLTVNVGDLVDLRGFTVKVTRVNPKSYSGVIVAPDNRNLNGWPGKWNRTDLRGIVQRAGKEPAK